MSKKFLKSDENLKFLDEGIFYEVLKDKVICKKFIELILAIKVESIKFHTKLYEVTDPKKVKSILADVQLLNKTITVQIQKLQLLDLKNEKVYATSCYDCVVENPKKLIFEPIKDVYKIYVCTFDPFGKDLPIYNMNNNLLALNPVFANTSKAKNVFVNMTSKIHKDLNDPIECLLEYLNTNQICDNFTNLLDEKISLAKKSLKNNYLDNKLVFSKSKIDKKNQIGLFNDSVELRFVAETSKMKKKYLL